MQEFLTVEEAAEKLRVKASTIRDLLRDGRLRGIKVGRLWRVPVAALEELQPGKDGRAITADK